jgi:hypothetical protein
LLKEKVDDLDMLHQKVLVLQDHESLERSLQQYRDEMEGLEKKRKECQDAAYFEKQAVLKECNDFVAYCNDLKDFQRNILNELADYVKCQDPLVIALSSNEEELLESM